MQYHQSFPYRKTEKKIICIHAYIFLDRFIIIISKGHITEALSFQLAEDTSDNL